MQKSLILLTLLIPLSGLCSTISPDLIAQSCATDSGNGVENYNRYGQRLAETLSQFSQEQLERIFQDNTSVTGNSTDFEALLGNAETLNEFLDLAPINFSSGSDTLGSNSEEQLDQVFTFLAEYPEARIIIEGHTENGGGLNQRLSEDRANAARDYIIALGADPETIQAIGLSNSQPFRNGDQSRRIEIRLNLE